MQPGIFENIILHNIITLELRQKKKRKKKEWVNLSWRKRRSSMYIYRSHILWVLYEFHSKELKLLLQSYLTFLKCWPVTSTAHGIISIRYALVLRTYWIGDTISKTRTHPMHPTQFKNNNRYFNILELLKKLYRKVLLIYFYRWYE